MNDLLLLNLSMVIVAAFLYWLTREEQSLAQASKGHWLVNGLLLVFLHGYTLLLRGLYALHKRYGLPASVLDLTREFIPDGLMRSAAHAYLQREERLRAAAGVDFGTSPHGLSADLQLPEQETRGALSLLSPVDQQAAQRVS